MKQYEQVTNKKVFKEAKDEFTSFKPKKGDRPEISTIQVKDVIDSIDALVQKNFMRIETNKVSYKLFKALMDCRKIFENSLSKDFK